MNNRTWSLNIVLVSICYVVLQMIHQGIYKEYQHLVFRDPRDEIDFPICSVCDCNPQITGRNKCVCVKRLVKKFGPE
jgi:hypothetical protein